MEEQTRGVADASDERTGDARERPPREGRGGDEAQNRTASCPTAPTPPQNATFFISCLPCRTREARLSGRPTQMASPNSTSDSATTVWLIVSPIPMPPRRSTRPTSGTSRSASATPSAESAYHPDDARRRSAVWSPTADARATCVTRPFARPRSTTPVSAPRVPMSNQTLNSSVPATVQRAAL